MDLQLHQGALRLQTYGSANDVQVQHSQKTPGRTTQRSTRTGTAGRASGLRIASDKETRSRFLTETTSSLQPQTRLASVTDFQVTLLLVCTSLTKIFRRRSNKCCPIAWRRRMLHRCRRKSSRRPTSHSRGWRKHVHLFVVQTSLPGVSLSKEATDDQHRLLHRRLAEHHANRQDLNTSVPPAASQQATRIRQVITS